MKLPADAIIAPIKFTRYLLVPQLRSDKSRYLARAGYAQDTVAQLIEDLRSQILPLDATFSRSTPFGEIFLIDGPLLGPSGVRIFVRTVWRKPPLPGCIHFVTLIPKPNPAE